MYSLLGPEKNFSNRWVGSEWLNRMQAHRRRMVLAERCAGLRRQMFRGHDAKVAAAIESIDRDGFAIVSDFLEPSAFAVLSNEVEAAVARVEADHPIRNEGQSGFGDKIPFDGGFDRYDGDTLNRFIDIDPATMPHASAFANNKDLAPLTRRIVGIPHRAQKAQIYITAHGGEDRNPDIQKVLHRDTFFSAMKFWYFIRPVRREDGPFMYVPRSHRLDEKRLHWEQGVADEILASDRRHPNTGGSFRIDEADLPRLGLPEPVALTCEANTLVIANVLGFHRRGHASGNNRRLAIYGWTRPYPFGFIGR